MTISDWIAIVGVLIAGGSLAYGAYQVHLNNKISRAQFWLELEKMFDTHDSVHLKLRPGGEWSTGNAGPSTIKEWADVEDYMGLFEHCEIMLQKNLIDFETFKSIFAYRINNIVHNKVIVKAKLIDHKHGWQDFIRLLNRLEVKIPEN